MVGRGYTKETVGLLNVNSIHLNTFNNPTDSFVWPRPTIEEVV
jgi:hypothetical protein